MLCWLDSRCKYKGLSICKVVQSVQLFHHDHLAVIMTI